MPSDMRFEEVDLILKDYGFEHVNTKGTHFSYVKGDKQITIVKHHNKVKKWYLKSIRDILDLEED